ncbi:hypothetical protein FOXB_02646 [Fusarium oxysporum f. sp. conglutinans Fo5176]|uniref:Uncharacterized protein n=1 Tax=Fusarium oxysporum (strain Fo5176) TaxID=660025 RepID=F9F8C1_FUSOF|nr:hypothetical protein FOXB_02646 [Fusarium oxysporum f. sp. conglutinans Fo5176]
MAMANFPSACLYNPVELEAGISLVTMKIMSPHVVPCTASLYFENADFLPITYDFKPIACSGPELVSFPVPLNAPNGESYVSWQCAGESPTCIRTLITGGQSDIDLDIGPLNFVCEEGSIDSATSQLYPSAARLDMPTFVLSTAVVTETITAATEEPDTRKVHVVTLTDTVVVEKTHIPPLLPDLSHLYPTFTPSPLTPTTCQTSTPTPLKISIGTVGTGGLPKATMAHSKMSLAEVTSAASHHASRFIPSFAACLLLVVYLGY